MSSVTRKFRYIDGQVREVTEAPRAPAVAVVGRSLLPMSHNSVEGYSISQSLPCPTPERIAKANEFVRSHGITGVHFDMRHRDNCRITDNRQYAKFLKVIGRHNSDGGFHGF